MAILEGGRTQWNTIEETVVKITLISRLPGMHILSTCDTVPKIDSIGKKYCVEGVIRNFYICYEFLQSGMSI